MTGLWAVRQMLSCGRSQDNRPETVDIASLSGVIVVFILHVFQHLLGDIALHSVPSNWKKQQPNNCLPLPHHHSEANLINLSFCICKLSYLIIAK